MEAVSNITQPTPTLLVVDDDPEVRIITVTILERAGYTVLQGASAADALSIAREHRPDLVLLDVMLPDGDGREVARQLKTDPELAGTFVVLLSGLKISPADQASGLIEGMADGYILRPVSAPVLRGWVESFLRLRVAQEQAEHYRQLFEAESDAVFLVDNETGQILEANRAATILYGYSLAELLTKKNTDLSAEVEETQRFRQETPVIPDQVVTIPLRFNRKKDGTIFPVEITSRFFTWRGRSVHLSAIRDITSRRQMEEALRQSENRFRALVENSGDALTLLDAGGAIIYEGPTVERLTGFSTQERLGKNGLENVHPADLTQVKSVFARVLATPGSSESAQFRSIKKDGTVWWTDATATNLLHEPAVQAIVINYRDITNHKQVEAALQESNQLLSLFMTHSPIFAYIKAVTPIESRVLLASENFLEMIGLSGSQMVGKTMVELFPPDFAAQITADDWAVVSSGKLLKLDEDLNGRHYTTIKFPLSLGDNNLLAGYTIDITDRKQAEAELRRINERFTGLAWQSRTYIWEVDPEGLYTYVSPNTESILGYRSEELMGKMHFYDLHPESEREAFKAMGLEIFSRKGVFHDLESAGQTKHGQTVWISTSGIPILSDDGRLAGYWGTDRDITDRKLAEVSLRESEERFRLLFEQLPLGYQSLDAEGRFIEVNHAWLNTLGYDREEVIGHWFGEFLPPPYVEAFRQRFPKFKEAGEVYNEFEMRRKDGSIIHVAFDGKIGYDREHHFKQTHCILHDITERKLAEAEREKLEAQTRQIQKAESLSRMAGAIAHHFNNQLAAVMGYLELTMLYPSLLPEDLSRNLTQAMAAAHRAAEVSSLMLTYLGQTPDKAESLDLSEVCAKNLSIIQAAMPKNVTLQTDWPTPGPIISANASRLQQLLTNLVTNSWEAMDDRPGKIDLRIKTVAPADISPANRFPLDWQPQSQVAYVCLEVVDTGSGIVGQDIEKLFDPFFSTKFTGRGLGLAAVLGIVRSMSGVVTVESQPGQGSIFRLFFPVKPAVEPLPPDTSALMAPVSGGVVLLVEDEEMVRQMATKMLDRLGFSVLTARDGVEAVDLFRQHQAEIRCVLCDLTMPRMDGWETLAALRQLSPDLPVVLASGYDEAYVMANPHPEYPQAFLGKPYQLKGMSAAITQALTKDR